MFPFLKFTRHKATSKVGSISFQYYKIGTGPRTVILLHGFGLTGLAWLPFIFTLKNDFTFIIPDLPGHGISKGTLPHSPVGFLDDYASCLDTLAKMIGPNQPYSLIGYSLGAYTSLYYLSKSDVVLPEKYMHIDHTLFPQHDEGWNGSMNNKILDQFKETHDLVVAGNEEVPYLDLDLIPSSIRQSYYRSLDMMNENSITNILIKKVTSMIPRLPVVGKAMQDRVEWPWAYAIIKAYYSGTFDLRKSIEKIQTPTLVLCGKNNSVFPPESMEYMHSRMAKVRLISFEKSNHDLLFNEPVQFTRILRNFLYQKEL